VGAPGDYRHGGARMTRGQIAQLQELSGCYLFGRDKWIYLGVVMNEKTDKLNKWERAQLRRLWHQYRHQIAAMRKNRGKA
jgi:hypothetical protein